VPEPCQVPRPRRHNAHKLTCRRFRLFPVRSPLLGESRLLSFPLGTEMVHFPRFASVPYGFRHGSFAFSEGGFPIRRPPDQSLFSDSPGLIAAGRVLHRLPAPRHPLYALSSLTIKFSQDKKCRLFNCQRTVNKTSIESPNLGDDLVPDILCWPEKRMMVELAGIEPATSGLQNRRSPD
jgi:hypothetical protein